MAWVAKEKAPRRNIKLKWDGTKSQLLQRYGPSESSVKRALLGRATTAQLNEMLNNRYTDGFTGSGRYRKRRRYSGRRRRTRRYYRGRGGYWGKKIGAGLGQIFGAPWMEDIGDKVGDFVVDAIPGMIGGSGMYTGSGAYDTAANELVNGAHTEMVIPQFTPSTDGSSVIISHKEYIGDLYGPPLGQSFSNQTYKINPGMEATFPWLSQVASNYVEYKLVQCIFTYKSTVAEFAAQSGQVGQIIGVTQYDANQEPMRDKRQMMEYDASQSTKTSSNLIMGVECDPSKNAGSYGKYIRTTSLDLGKDLNDYDHGTFNLAVHDTPDTYANQVLGEVWVSYTVELRKPKVFTGKGRTIQNDIFVGQSNGSLPLVQGQSSTLFGKQPALKGERNSLGCKLDYNVDTISLQGKPVYQVTTLPANPGDPDLALTNSGIIQTELLKHLRLHTPTTLVNLDGSYRSLEAYDAYLKNPLTVATKFQELVVTIPATYSGNLKICLRTNPLQVREEASDIIALDSELFVMPNIVFWGLGNLHPIKDIPSNSLTHHNWDNTSADHWTSGTRSMYPANKPNGNTDFTTTDAYFTNYYEAHFRVEQASNGNENQVIIQVQVTGRGTTAANPTGIPIGFGANDLGCALRSSILTIEEYNTSQSYSQNGGKDELVLVDHTGERVDKYYVGGV